jgi:hypothetical protein
MKTYEYSSYGNFITIEDNETGEFDMVHTTFDFQEILEAIKSKASYAKGKIENGVEWAYDHATGAIKFTCGACSRLVDTIVDGVRRSYEWLVELLSNIFAK